MVQELQVLAQVLCNTFVVIAQVDAPNEIQTCKKQ